MLFGGIQQQAGKTCALRRRIDRHTPKMAGGCVHDLRRDGTDDLTASSAGDERRHRLHAFLDAFRREHRRPVCLRGVLLFVRFKGASEASGDAGGIGRGCGTN
jgi:hypothetical protein